MEAFTVKPKPSKTPLPQFHLGFEEVKNTEGRKGRAEEIRGFLRVFGVVLIVGNSPTQCWRLEFLINYTKGVL
jgi:hypothetical protein